MLYRNIHRKTPAKKVYDKKIRTKNDIDLAVLKYFKSPSTAYEQRFFCLCNTGLLIGFKILIMEKNSIYKSFDVVD